MSAVDPIRLRKGHRLPPKTGFVTVYAKEDGTLWQRDEAGAEAPVGTGEGGSGIPQGGPLTEDLLTGGFNLTADGASLNVQGGVLAEAASGADSSGGVFQATQGIDDDGGLASLRGGDGSAEDGARVEARGGTATEAGRVSILTNDNDGDSGDLLTAQGDGTALWAVPIVQRVTIDLDAADIATLNTVPVEVVAAPGANKVIVPVAASFQYKAGAVAFDFDAALGLFLDPAGIVVDFATEPGLVDVIDKVVIRAPSGSGEGPDIVNKPLTLKADADPDGAGDGTARLTVLYYVMDLL